MAKVQDETKAKVARVEALIKDGMAPNAACKENQMTQSWFYASRKRIRDEEAGGKEKKKKPSAGGGFETVVLQPAASSDVSVQVSGDPRSVAEFIKGLGSK